MRFVPIKSVEQQDVQNIHRERIKKERTALVNQIRGLLAEYGIVMDKKISVVGRELPLILEDAENELTPLSRELFNELLDELRGLDQRLARCEKRLKAVNQENAVCLRLDEVLGIGNITASALYAAVGDGKDFANGRHLSAWLGLALGQHRVEARLIYWAVVSEETPTCARYSFTVLVLFCVMPQQKQIVLVVGTKCFRASRAQQSLRGGCE